MAERDNNSIEFGIREIEIGDFGYDSAYFALNKVQKVQTKLQTATGYVKAVDRIVITCHVEVVAAEEEKVVAHQSVSCSYFVSDLSSYAGSHDGEITLPTALLETLTSITISTLRGIFYAQFRSTGLGAAAILPIVDPKQFTSVSE